MAHRQVDRASAPVLLAMIDRLQPDTPRRWGTMSPTAMVCHCAHALRATTHGDPSIKRRRVRTPRWLMRVVALSDLPWPRGIKAPEGVTVEAPEGVSLDDARDQFREGLTGLLDHLDEHPDHRIFHPILGWLTARQLRRFHWVHCRHHFTQFRIWHPHPA